MNTPSHFLMTAALEKALPRIPIVKSAFLLGAVAPDIPLWVLSIGGIVYYHLIRGWSLTETASLLFDTLYFHHPLWIVLHNLLHAPLLLLLGLVIASRSRYRSRWWFWFLLACLLHAVVDILTHATDGPLLLFPLDWTTRFHSPISYYDPHYHGDEFQRFELCVDSVCLAYLTLPLLYRKIRFRKRAESDRV